MIESRILVRGESFVLSEVVCRHGRGGAGGEELSPAPAVGFPLAGLFRKHGAARAKAAARKPARSVDMKSR